MGATLAQVLHTFGLAYRDRHALSTAQARAWRAIVACRTPALGGQVQQLSTPEHISPFPPE